MLVKKFWSLLGFSNAVLLLNDTNNVRVLTKTVNMKPTLLISELNSNQDSEKILGNFNEPSTFKSTEQKSWI